MSNSIPARISGVTVAHDVSNRRSDGAIEIIRGTRLVSSDAQVVSLAAMSGYTAQPRYALRSMQQSIRCSQGEVFAVAADLRLGSPTFGQWQGFYLQQEDGRTLHVPSGVALGWQVCSPSAEIETSVNTDCVASQWRWIDWTDAELDIHWPLPATKLAKQLRRSRILSELPDSKLPKFRTAHAKKKPPSKRRIQAESEHCEVIRPSTQLASADLPAPPIHFKVHAAGTVLRSKVDLSNRKNRILLLGSSGRLGRDLTRHLRRLGAVIEACREPDKTSLPVPMQLDVSRPASIRQVIAAADPTLIVNATGLSNVDLAETEPRLAQLINATAPAVMAEEAERRGAGLIHFCNDMVFDGAGERPYRESDTPEPKNQMARTKLLGTAAIEASGVHHMILRTGWLYSTHGDNYVKRIIDLLSYRNTITLPSDHFGCPTSTQWLAKTIATVLSRANGDYLPWLEQNGGLFHVSMLGYGSRVDVADQILAVCKSHGMPVALNRIQGMPLADLPGIAEVPRNCRLDPSRFATQFDLQLPRWQDELRNQVATILEEILLPRSAISADKALA